MAKYQIKYSCGHTEEVALFGKMEDRARKIEWLEKEGVCSTCYRAQQEENARKQAEELNLPKLEGTEKQVKWAVQIRKKVVDKFLEIIKKVSNKEGEEFFWQAIAEKTQAKFWIDNEVEGESKLAIIQSMIRDQLK